MARVRGLIVHPGWATGWVDVPEFAFLDGDDRATGEFTPDKTLLGDLQALTGETYEVFAFQAYRNGSGTDWHRDTPFDAQAVLSLGVTRTFGARPVDGEPVWLRVAHGDLVVMPAGFQDDHEHRVLPDDSIGERVSLVFRTVRR